MIANIYTYKGSNQTLVGPWVTAGYLLNDESLDYENIVPHLKHIYKKRKDINKFDYILKGYLDIKTTFAYEINFDGDYCVVLAQKEMARRLRSHGNNITINIIQKPKLWYERLTVLAAVFYRTEYLRRRSENGYDLLQLENDLESHLELLMTYRHLPPSYIWDKSMDAVENIEPKPRWWDSEINTLRRELNYDAPC